ncbi:3-oxoacyl-[acyl-carrier-protein] synthase III C-terminal domain-containing protein [Acinetobacter pollinis]|uniref:Beta-ketoacyl-[acyl-carrier-protein] synthase III C-terminal domain-containing protein n=1 Tax=Acinetobacter pollinis TaxID=2605270 RepID=A0ABU6DWJ3_9GAMM|nr:3-oxoacyl-[acyl-carrier-protein] synthase III C-terminal domain-containing protein [Acinetobacter pollinis]MEB5477846.1 hypothetical protein [Acinetobacter pollinis]
MKIIDIGTYLPKKHIPTSLEISNLESDFNKYSTIAIENNLFPLDMLYESILPIKSNKNLNNINWLIHNSYHFNGYNHYHSPTCWLQNKLEIENLISLNVNHGCNGLMSIFLACNLLKVEENSSVLCTFSERFNTSDFSRWNADYNLIYADGAASVVVSNNSSLPSLATILSIQHTSTPQLEGLARLAQPKCIKEFNPHDIRTCKFQFIRRGMSIQKIQEISSSAIQNLVKDIKKSTNSEKLVIDHLILPNFGYKTLKNDYLPYLPIPNKTCSIDWGLTVGHIGSSDCFIRLKELLDNKQLSSKDTVLVLSVGVGVTWTMALLEID